MCKSGKKVIITADREDATYLKKGDVGYISGCGCYDNVWFYAVVTDKTMLKKGSFEYKNAKSDLFEEHEIEYIE